MEDLVPIRFLEENVLIGNDLVPTRRLEGDVVCREYWILDTGYWILDTGYWILDTNNKVYLYGIFMSRKI